jgi:hypothetical protein
MAADHRGDRHSHNMALLDFLNPRKKAEQTLIENLQKASNLVKMGLYARLVAKYAGRYDLNFAKFLAATVSNEVFSDPPGNEQSRGFLEQHKDIIEQELREFRKDRQICNFLTQMLRARAIIPFARGVTGDTWIDPLDKLQHYGILVPGGSAPTPETLVPLVNEF